MPFVALSRLFPRTRKVLLLVFLVLQGLVLTGCMTLPGEPAAPKDVALGLTYQSVHQKILYEGFLENRYIFHRPDGLATYFRQTNTAQGYTRETRVGKWSAQPGQVCYEWKSGSKCHAVHRNEGKLIAAHGDIRYRDVGGTQRRNGLNVIEPREIANAPSIGEAIARNPALQPVLRGLGAYVQASEAIYNSGGTRNYSCEVQCDDLDNKVPITVYGSSDRDAENNETRLDGQVC